MSVELFIGLVTHPRTRFIDSAGPTGLVRQLSHAMTKAGVTCEVSISDQDDYADDLLTIDQLVIANSITAELDLEQRWARYLNPGRRLPFLKLRMNVHERIRRRKFLGSNEKAGQLMVKRLINIELAHLKLLKEAANCDARWCLIVEDDAIASDLSALAGNLKHFIEVTKNESKPKYVNLSQSFDDETLKVDDQFRMLEIKDQEVWNPQNVLAAKRPITNTVCAVLYRGTFVRELLQAYMEIPLEPVVPIDWKLNSAIMNLYSQNSLGDGDCWFIEPGPIVQRSMHAS